MFRTAVRRAPSSKAILAGEAAFSAHNYAPVPVVFSKAKGCIVTDPEGKTYIDFLSGYGAVSQGHVHPKVVAAAKKQLSMCTLSSRAFYNDQLAVYAQYVTKMFKYDKVLPMNTGAEGVETALKLARKWGYKVKGIKKNQAKIVCATGNFHGRTFGAIAMSDDPSSYENYGPKLSGFVKVKYGDAAALEAVFAKHHKVMAGFICEPIQGEAGVCIPPAGYLKKVRQLCDKYKVLYIDDEVQAGLGRSGKLLAVEHEAVRPDIVILAKALGAGVLPVAAVLADNKVMDVIEPGTHGSTFGGSPLSSAVAVAALKALKEEKLVENSAKMGALLDARLKKLAKKYKFIKATRCRGLFAAIEMDKKFLKGKSGVRLMYVLKDLGLLSKVTHNYTIRLSPPLVMKKGLLSKSCDIIDKGLKALEKEGAIAKAAKKAFKLKAKKAQAAKKAAKKTTTKKTVKK